MLALAVTMTVACSPVGTGGGSPSSQSPAPPAAQQSVTVRANVGQLAPGFEVKTLDGLILTSADLLAQQKPYILYFFASW